jgi:PAS domain S-box-containing protein
MMIQTHSRRSGNYALLPVTTAAVATLIFIADTVTEVNIPVGVFYVAVVLMTARFCRARGVVLVAAGCVGLTVLSYFLSRPDAPSALGVIDTLIGIAAIGLTSFLALQSQSSEETLREQASLLDLTHDTIFVRDMHDSITYWNRGAEDRYGWVRDEAVGKVSHELMQTIFPSPLKEINAELLRSGRWEGELLHTKRDGTQVVVASRWALQRNEQGSPISILETNNDITERRRAEYLTGQMFESSPDGISVVGTDYRYQRVNPVYERNWGMPAERIVGKHVADLLGTSVFEQTIKPYLDRCFEGEEVSYAEWFTNSLSRRYLVVSYSPLRSGSERVEAVLLITRDLTDQMLASEALRTSQAELAHVNRVATMGQLTASIAHEVNQPIAAAVINAQAALRWLGTQPPNLEEVRQALGRIVEDGKRAGNVIGRIRALIKKAPPRKRRFDLNETVLDVIVLIRSEAVRHGVSLKTQLAKGLPLVEGDRVQLQQVILNLIMNAVEAMSGIAEGARELQIRTETEAAGDVLVTVQDSGPGLDPTSVDRVFEAFYTTKPDGMGMGLAICRSIIEAHGGRMWATANEPHGAIFQFTLLPGRDETASAEQAGPMRVV